MFDGVEANWLGVAIASLTADTADGASSEKAWITGGRADLVSAATDSLVAGASGAGSKFVGTSCEKACTTGGSADEVCADVD